jgi:hypothetical protein
MGYDITWFKLLLCDKRKMDQNKNNETLDEFHDGVGFWVAKEKRESDKYITIFFIHTKNKMQLGAGI